MPDHLATGGAMRENTEKRRIIILGSGFAGAYCAKSLERSIKKLNLDVVMVDRHNYFVFYPLLVEAGTGTLQPRHAVVPIRAFLKRIRFVMADIESVDTSAQTVRIDVAGDSGTQTLHYDHLVLAMGSVSNLPPVPGLIEYAYEMKSVGHAVALRDRVIQLLEEANASDDPAYRRALLHLVVVGGNFTGVEVAGEFQEYMSKAVRVYPNLSEEDCRVTLIDRGHAVLKALEDEELSQWSAEHLRRRGIELRLGESVDAIYADHAVLQSNKQKLPTHTVIWCAGIAAPPLLAEMPVPLDGHGYLLCDRELRVQGFENIWGIGDCAVNIDADGKSYPATAQHATREGKHLAKNLDRVLQGKPPTVCNVKTLGALAAFGRFDAVAKILGWRFTGFVAWFLWRTVYLAKIPGFTRGLRVAIDWTVALLFDREYAEMGIHRIMRPTPEATAAEKKQQTQENETVSKTERPAPVQA
jgi:NADH dehydrogenase